MTSAGIQGLLLHERLRGSFLKRSWEAWRKRKLMQGRLKRSISLAIDGQTTMELHRVVAMKRYSNGRVVRLTVDCIPISTQVERVDAEDDDAGIYPSRKLVTHQYLAPSGHLVWRMPDEPFHWLYGPTEVEFVPLLEEMNKHMVAYNQSGYHATVT